MPITRKIYRKGEKPMPFTAEQLAEIEALKHLSDADIDTSDDSANSSSWIKANLEKIKSTPFSLEPRYKKAH